jgi:RNA polymerase primary sigma factor
MRQLKLTNHVTPRDSYSVEKYLSEISHHDLLTADQEAELARKIREDDHEALEKLVSSNLRFVVSVAKQYQNQGLPLSDLINEGNLGLIRAARKFDETRGFKFISYAVWWIRQAIMQSIVEQSRIIKLPINKAGAYAKVTKAFAQFEQQFQREPDVEELMEMLGMTKEEIKEYFRSHSTSTVSTDMIIGGTDSVSLNETLYDKEVLSPEEEMEKKAAEDQIMTILKNLPERDLEIITSYYGLMGKQPMTLEEIGARFSLTRERVRQIKERCLRRLKEQTSPQLLQVLGT